MSTITRSVATTSWIDHRLHHPITLPETDEHSRRDYTDNASSITRAFLLGEVAYRFANFLEVEVTIDNNRITSHRFTNASKMYRAPSYLGIESDAHDIRRRTTGDNNSGITFTQLVGCRTVSPETIARWGGAVAGLALGVPGAVLGWFVGEEVVEEISVFPPIWTEISLTIYPNGLGEQVLVRHSHFPSNCFYRLLETGTGPSTLTYERRSLYDARSQIDYWKENGWGTYNLRTNTGNPWNVKDPSVFGSNPQPPSSTRRAGTHTGPVHGALASYQGPVRGGAREPRSFES